MKIIVSYQYPVGVPRLNENIQKIILHLEGCDWIRVEAYRPIDYSTMANYNNNVYQIDLMIRSVITNDWETIDVFDYRLETGNIEELTKAAKSVFYDSESILKIGVSFNGLDEAVEAIVNRGAKMQKQYMDKIKPTFVPKEQEQDFEKRMSLEAEKVNRTKMLMQKVNDDFEKLKEFLPESYWTPQKIAEHRRQLEIKHFGEEQNILIPQKNMNTPVEIHNIPSVSDDDASQVNIEIDDLPVIDVK